MKSYESGIYHVVKPKAARNSITMRPPQPTIQFNQEKDKSLNINCKTLFKTFASNIFTKLLNKKSVSKAKELVVVKKLNIPVNMHISPPHEFKSDRKFESNCFANFGDIVYYNV